LHSHGNTFTHFVISNDVVFLRQSQFRLSGLRDHTFIVNERIAGYI
jgi:hypothetical protein